jgi:SAM-dependent methyltransferase
VEGENAMPAAVQQKVVDAHFAAAASYWAGVYEQCDTDAIIFQRRLASVIELVQGIALPARSRVLEIGSGAGYASVALARLGHVVDAIDPVPTMREATRSRAIAAGFGDSVRTGPGEINALPFVDARFALVVAMGVLPWLPSIDQAVREICRVLRADGHAIVTVDNRWGLRQFVEPYTNPLLRPAKALMKRALRRRRAPRAVAHSISIAEFGARLRAHGLEPVGGLTVGFGGFTVFNRALLPGWLDLRVHDLLQRAADRGLPLVRSSGSQHVVLARRLPS